MNGETQMDADMDISARFDHVIKTYLKASEVSSHFILNSMFLVDMN